MSRRSFSLPLGTTLEHFLGHEQETQPRTTGKLARLLRDIALTAKGISYELNRSGLPDGAVGGPTSSWSGQGKDQRNFEAIASLRFIQALRRGGDVGGILLKKAPDLCQTGSPDGDYIVALDPLNGAENIELNGSAGTIFSVYRRVSPAGGAATCADGRQPGTAQVAAGYVLYGLRTLLVCTIGHGVQGFTYEPSLGEFFLSHPVIQTPETGAIYTLDESGAAGLPPQVAALVRDCKAAGLAARCTGSLVADFHRVLLGGGLCLYPATAGHPQGERYLVQESNPLAFLLEQAGGGSSNGHRRTLTIAPQCPQEHGTAFMGSRDLVAWAGGSRAALRGPAAPGRVAGRPDGAHRAVA